MPASKTAASASAFSETPESPREVAARRAWLSVVRAYNLCDTVMSTRLSAMTLRVGEHEILTNLQVAPGMTQQTLAKRCFVTKSGISMLVQRMEAQGLLRREASEFDARIKCLFLNPQGVALAKQALALQKEVVDEMSQSLSQDELDTLLDITRRVGQTLEGMR
jgi:DNA-binding MarR family transcriptional regulator